jgi:hypothetical protein
MKNERQRMKHDSGSRFGSMPARRGTALEGRHSAFRFAGPRDNSRIL